MNQFYVKNLVLILLLSTYVIAFSQKSLHKIDRDQKLYELSVVWKELSYNFANMDNCPGLKIDYDTPQKQDSKLRYKSIIFKSKHYVNNQEKIQQRI